MYNWQESFKSRFNTKEEVQNELLKLERDCKNYDKKTRNGKMFAIFCKSEILVLKEKLKEICY